jgi:two-component system, NarL family, sensor histidine kinase DesK
MNGRTYPANGIKNLCRFLPGIKKFCAFFFSCLAILILAPYFSPAQQGDAQTFDISAIQFSFSLSGYVFFERPDTAIAEHNICGADFSQKFHSAFNKDLPFNVAGKNIYLKFATHNGSDSIVQAYFFPGSFFTEIKVFKSCKGLLTKSFSGVEKAPFDDNISSSLALLALRPRETAVFYIVLSPLKSHMSLFSPQIINKNFLGYFKTHISHEPMNVLTYLISGFLLMMIFYSLAHYFQDFRTAFFYYAAYAFCTGLLLFLKSYFNNYTITVNYYFEGCFDFILQSTGLIFYIAFIRKFLQTGKEPPFLERVFHISQYITIFLLLLFFFAYFFSDSFTIPYIIENLTKFLLVALTLLFIVYGLSKNNKVINYLVAGQSMLILFSSISFALVMTTMPILKKESEVLNDPMLYFETGVALEMAFFFTALAYKNKKDIAERTKESERLKSENERKEIEKQIAVMEAKNDERKRISADMHDELGSGVTAIRLMSEIVKTKMKEKGLPEINRISSSANDLLDKMNSIIWTMNSSNDSAESLITYIRAYAAEFFENTLIDCRVNMPGQIPVIEISGEKRRNIFLSVKEALNNVLKHSHASAVTINITINQILVIEIGDNGNGIHPEKIRKFGNGINNMKKRMGTIGGNLTLQNHNGAILIFTLQL